MKTIEELKTYFETILKPQLSELEKWRKKAFLRAKITDVFFVPIFLSLFAFFVYISVCFALEEKVTIGDIIGRSTFNLVVFLILAGIIKSVLDMIGFPASVRIDGDKRILSKNLQNQNDYKKIVVGGIINFIFKDLNYSPETQGISGKEFLEAEIFPHLIYYPRGYVIDDLVEGKIGQTALRFYEINGKSVLLAKGQKSNVVDGTIERIPFFGIFFIIDFNKSFCGHTLVLPETKIRKSNWMTNSGRVIVKMDDPEFENLFSVYGTDQIVARYILSSALMKRISDFRKKVGKKMYLSFTNNKLYIAISRKKELFEFKLNKSLLSFDTIPEFYTDLKIATDIVEDLNLNNRIWIKEGESEQKMFEKRNKYKPKKRWIFRLLALFFGYTGIHFLYIGQRGIALLYFLITIAVFPFLIYKTILNQGNGASGFFLMLFAIVWFLFVNFQASSIYNDSKGIDMD